MNLSQVYSWINIKFLLEGFIVTLQVAVLAIVFSFLMGLLLGFLRHLKISILSPLLTFWVDIIRNLPLLLHILVVYFALPQIGIRLHVFWAAVVALTIFESAMISEIIRAGLESIPQGQREAGYSTALTTWQTYLYIIIPQALRAMVPSLVTQFITLIKDSSLAAIIALPDLTHHARVIYNQNTQAVIPMFMAMTLLYFLVCFSLSRASSKLELIYQTR